MRISYAILIVTALIGADAAVIARSVQKPLPGSPPILRECKAF